MHVPNVGRGGNVGQEHFHACLSFAITAEFVLLPKSLPWRTLVTMSSQIAPRGRAYAFTVGDRIRVAREQAGMEQRELAEATGISRNTISNYEQGKFSPRRPALAAIALATGFDYRWLESGELPACEPPGGAPINPVPTTPDNQPRHLAHALVAA